MVYLEASSFHILDFNSLNRFPHVNIYKCALTPFILKAQIQDAAGARTKTEGVWFMTESRLTGRVGINTCPQKKEKCNSASVFLQVLGIHLQYYSFASLKEAVQIHTLPDTTNIEIIRDFLAPIDNLDKSRVQEESAHCLANWLCDLTLV